MLLSVVDVWNGEWYSRDRRACLRLAAGRGRMFILSYGTTSIYCLEDESGRFLGFPFVDFFTALLGSVGLMLSNGSASVLGDVGPPYMPNMCGNTRSGREQISDLCCA